MIKPITPIDASALVNAMAKQLCGQDALKTVDLSNFVDVGSLVMATGYDNVIGQISSLIGRVVNEGRSYEGSFWSILADDTTYSNRKLRRKYYSKASIEAGSVNTDQGTPISEGVNPETDGYSQWVENFAPILEEFFGGSNAYSYQMPTVTEDALKDAFRSAEELAGFLNGQLQEAYNEIEQEKETRIRMAVLNRIAGIHAMVAAGDLGAECEVDLIAYANQHAGTSYSRYEWLEEHMDELMKQISVKLETDSKRLTNRTVKYHWNPTKTFNGVSYELKDFTPQANQKMLYLDGIMDEMETRVLPTIFHADMLKNVVDKAGAKAEGVSYWQAFDSGYGYDYAKIDVEANIPTSNSKVAVKLPFVFGMLYDERGLMMNVQFENSRTTPVHARTGIINTFNNYKFCPINMFTDNAIIYVFGNGVEETESFEGDGSETDFVISGNVHEFIGVTVNGTAVDADDYDYDEATQTISFDTAPAASAEIIVSYI